MVSRSGLQPVWCVHSRYLQGEQDSVDGDLLLILWGNRADPIITGREDLGYAKLYCELPSLSAFRIR